MFSNIEGTKTLWNTETLIRWLRKDSQKIFELAIVTYQYQVDTNQNHNDIWTGMHQKRPKKNQFCMYVRKKKHSFTVDENVNFSNILGK